MLYTHWNSTFSGFSIKGLSDTHGHIKLVFPNDYDMLLSELNNAISNKIRVEIVESFFLRQLNKSKTLDERIYPLVNYILRTKGTDNLKKVAQETAFGRTDDSTSYASLCRNKLQIILDISQV